MTWYYCILCFPMAACPCRPPTPSHLLAHPQILGLEASPQQLLDESEPLMAARWGRGAGGGRRGAGEGARRDSNACSTRPRQVLTLHWQPMLLCLRARTISPALLPLPPLLLRAGGLTRR